MAELFPHPIDFDIRDANGLSLDIVDPTPYHDGPSHRQLLLEQHVTNLEKSASGFQPLPCMDEYPHGTGYFHPNMPGPSPGDVHAHLAPPLERYASSSGSVGGDESCLSGPSWDICTSAEQTPMASPMHSPLQYQEHLGPQSPMIGTTGALFPGDGRGVHPQEVQPYPEMAAEISSLQFRGAPRSIPAEWTQCHPPVDPALKHSLKRHRPSQPLTSYVLSQTSSHSQSSSGPSSGRKPKTQSKPKKPAAHPQGRHATDGAVFLCAFASFGCPCTFTAKNEWKRHVATIHLQLDVYICDLGYCGHQITPASTDADSPAISYPPPSRKAYNRKDLFTQHLRRMHPGHQATTDYDPSSFSKSTSERCLVRLRSPPNYWQCPYCARDSAGEDIWDDRMEHVARHVEAGDAVVRADEGLREWAAREGIIVEERDGSFVLAERVGGRKRKADL